jgi:hypothetical protein
MATVEYGLQCIDCFIKCPINEAVSVDQVKKFLSIREEMLRLDRKLGKIQLDLFSILSNSYWKSLLTFYKTHPNHTMIPYQQEKKL